jgi:tripartite-type tricarboxylate transporter receptor subunit TctC
MMQIVWKIKKRFILFLFLLFLIPALSSGQEYPTKPINLLVNFPPGGTTDLSTRPLAGKAEKFLGQPIIVSNVGGGGGSVGLGTAAKHKPDGYHLVSCSIIGLVWHPHFRELPYSYKDFVSVANFVRSRTGIVVKSDAPWKTFNELVEYAKKNPGKVTYSTVGAYSPAHVFTDYLGKKLGIQWIHIPQKGGAASITALLGGHVTFYNGSEEWVPHVRSGEFRLLVTLADKRMRQFPDVPALRELGHDLVNQSYFLVAAPKGTPPFMVNKLEEAFKKATEDPEYIQAIEKIEMEVCYLSSKDTGKLVEELFNDYKKLLTELNLIKEPEKK